MRAPCCLAILLLFAMPAPAMAADGNIVMPGQTVGVFPLTYRYQVAQEYTRTVVESDAYLKGNFRENGRDSSKASTQAHDSGASFSSSSSDSASANSSHNASGTYDLKKGARVSGETFRDRTITEKQLDSLMLTGTLESALSQAGIRIADRSTMDKVFAERKKASDPEFSSTAVQKAVKMHLADYLLTGQIESFRVEGVRTVPDGSNQRYGVGGVVKVNLKIVSARDGTSAFARTFTGKARRTFDKADPVPADEVMAAAMDDLAAQIVSALTGVRRMDSDDGEYQDSPGKRLK